MIAAARRVSNVVLQAPAGYGKSTVLRDVRAQAAADPNAAAVFCAFSPAEGSPDRFVRVVSAAAVEAGLAPPEWTPAAAAAPSASPLARLVELFDFMDGSGCDVFVIFDDYHLVDNDKTQIFLETLFRRTYDRVKFVIATRRRLAAATERLTLEGRLSEFLSTELALSLGEFKKALEEGAWDLDSIERVYAKTQGWPAAVPLVRLLKKDASALDVALDDFSGDQEKIFRYLSQECFDYLDAELQDFMLSTCVLDNFDSAMADDMFGDRGAARQIQSLRALGLFLETDRLHKGFFRYHTLFLDFLRAKLAVEKSALELEELHRRASDCRLRQGDVLGALEHAVRAKDQERVVSILEAPEALDEIWLSRMAGRVEPLRDEIMRLWPKQTVRLFPIFAFCLAQKAQFDDAKQLLTQAKNAFRRLEPDLPGQTAEALRIELATGRLLLELYRHAPGDAADAKFLREAVANPLRVKPASAAAIHNILGVFDLRNGGLAASKSHLDRAISLYRDAGSFSNIIFCLVHNATIALESLDAPAAAAALADARRMAREDVEPTAIDILDVAQARVDFLAAASAEGLTTVREGLADALGRATGGGEVWVEFLVDGYEAQASLVMAQSGAAAAFAVLDRGESFAGLRHLEPLRRALLGVRLRLASALGDLDAAEDARVALGSGFEDLDLGPDAFGWRESVTIAVGLIRHDIALGRFDQALQRIDTLDSVAASRRLPLVGLKASVLRTLALFAAGEQARATEVLRPLLPVIDTGHRAILLREGVLAERFLDDAAVRISRSTERETLAPRIVALRRLTACFRPMPATQQAEEPSPPRGPALDVLRMLAGGMRPKEISSEVGITVDGVNYHLKRMRKRYGVRTTSALIAEALRHGVLRDGDVATEYRRPAVDLARQAPPRAAR